MHAYAVAAVAAATVLSLVAALLKPKSMILMHGPSRHWGHAAWRRHGDKPCEYKYFKTRASLPPGLNRYKVCARIGEGGEGKNIRPLLSAICGLQPLLFTTALPRVLCLEYYANCRAGLLTCLPHCSTGQCNMNCDSWISRCTNEARSCMNVIPAGQCHPRSPMPTAKHANTHMAETFARPHRRPSVRRACARGVPA